MIRRDSFVVFFPLEYDYNKVTNLLFNDDGTYSENIQILLSPSKDVYDTLLNIFASNLLVFTKNAKEIIIDNTIKENPETVMWIRICNKISADFIEEDTVTDLVETIKEKYNKWNQK
jgi:hypothetical protein